MHKKILTVGLVCLSTTNLMIATQEQEQRVVLEDGSIARRVMKIPLTKEGETGDGKNILRIFVVNEDTTNITNVVDVSATANATATANASEEGWLSGFLGKNYKVIVGGIVLSYACVLYKIKSLQSYLEGEGLWSNWRNELSLAGLYVISDEDLVKDLLLAIQRQYAGFTYTENYDNPVTNFLEEVKEERSALREYERWAKGIKMLPFFLSKIFFLEENLIRGTVERRQRLDYLSSKIIHWMRQQERKHVRKLIKL